MVSRRINQRQAWNNEKLFALIMLLSPIITFSHTLKYRVSQKMNFKMQKMDHIWLKKAKTKYVIEVMWGPKMDLKWTNVT